MKHDGADSDFTMKTDDHDILEAGRERAWRMLDLLPKGEAHPSLAATTIEMSAVTTAGGREAGRPEASHRSRWVIAGAVIAAALAAGFVAGSRGRAIPEDPLAIAVGRRIAVLREAGSVEFLRMLASRDIPPPRRPGRPRTESDEADLPEPYPALDAAIEDFRAVLAVSPSPPPRDPRRIDEALRSLQGLSAGEFQAAMSTARALADAGGEPLVEAARRWHEWVLASDPVERRILPTLGTRERLEWIARRSRPWRQPGFRGPFPPPPGGGPPPVRFPREFPRETREQGG